MRHSTWLYLSNWMVMMACKYGGVVYDINGQTWDWGQALCREVYGEDWMHNKEFLLTDDIPPEDPAPEKMIEAAQAWEKGNFPDWVIGGKHSKYRREARDVITIST